MPRTKGSKNKPKTVTADFATQIAEKQSAKEALTAEIASITANIDTLKADLKVKKTALKKAEKEVATLEAKKEKADAKGKPDLNILFTYNMPFRAIAKMTGGMVSEKMVDDILFIVNGHFFRGFGRLIVDVFKNISANNAFMKELAKESK